MSIEQEVLSVAIDEIRGLITPSPAERNAAYELVVEIASRSASFRVSSVDGTIRESLDAVGEMFELTRSILRTHGIDATRGSAGNLSLAVIAVRVLNEVFSPVLARWGPRLDDHEARRAVDAPDLSPVEWERRWPWGPQCRTELDAMAASVRAYLDTLSRIAGTPEVADAVLHPPSSHVFEQRALTASAHPDVDRPGAARPRRNMVRWLDLAEMYRTGVSHLRHSEAHSRPEEPVAPVAAFAAVRGEDFWFDYVADMGDGFDGTAPVAYLMGRHRISIPDDRSGEFPSPPAFLPRSPLLVFGGDQVYPYATRDGYLNQTELPWSMGVEDPGGERATLITIPGNHDWLGGIEHFEEMFASGRVFAGRWETPQRRVFWHAKLPQGWWLWGIDTGLHNEWPREQVAYFERAADELRAGDRVILCSPVPLWQLRQKYPEDYVRMRSALDPMIARRGATMPLCLSGDSHFFAHYERIESEQREDHITAGGGGAFLQPTHNLPERVPHERGNAEFRLSTRWPSPTDSRSLASDARRALDPRNWLLGAVFAALHLAYAGLLALDPWHRDAELDRPVFDGSFDVTWSGPWSTLLLLLLVVAGSFVLKPNSVESKLAKGARLYGMLVGVALAASFLLVAFLRNLVAGDPSVWLAKWVWLLVSVVVGGLLSLAVLFVALKWANAHVRAGDTAAFSSSHSTRFKHFLRCRIDRDGDLTVYVVGIDPVGEGWYEAMTEHLTVPPFDRAGMPRIHYVWGRTYQKFVPVPMEVAVSVSDPGEDGPSPDAAFLSMCSRLIDGGHTLLYGGLPSHYGGFTQQLRQIEVARHADNPNADHHLVNYVADPYWDDARRHDELVQSIHVERIRADEEDPVLGFVRDLSGMRRRMTADADVRVVIGGALTPGAPGERLAPGVLEEAYLAMRSGLPLIVIGGFGGAARLIADALFDRLDPVEVDRLERHFLEPGRLSSGDEHVAGFREMLCAFTSLGQLRNELLDGENRELMTTCDPETITSLVWRSLHRLGRRRTR